jgi:hypothetical protein
VIPYLSFWRVLGGLEASFTQAKLSRVSGIQGVHHSVEEFRSTGFESDFGDSGTWVVLTVVDLSVGIFLGVIGHFWQQGRIVEELQLSSRAWHLPTRGFSILMTQIYLYSVFIVYPAFGGLL